MEFKKIISSAAAFCMGMSSFAGLAAVNVFAADNSLSITRQTGWLESAYVTWTNTESVDGYNVYVKPEGGSYTKIDDELVRYYGSYYRADAPGLAAGKYQMKVAEVKNGAESDTAESSTLTVVSHIREGFAFDPQSSYYNADGVGAYKNDGTLKDGAKVVYITDANKDSVKFDVITNTSKGTVTTCTGLGEILSAREKNGAETTPLAIRMIGQVEAPSSVNSAKYMQIKATSNVTFEGVGDDATTYHWSFLIRQADNIEVRNLAVMEFYDDGISLDTKNYNCWVHNCDIFYGQNRGGDQKKGDGSLDVKSGSDYCSFSYNHFWDSGKTSLCGMKADNNQGYHMTYYGNWFDHSDSRHPRVRGDQVHIYNNYYDGIAKYGVGACTGSSVYVEKNVFRNAKYAVLISQQGSDVAGGAVGTFSGEDGGIIKMYDNKITGGNSIVAASSSNTNDFDAYIASSRNETVSSSYKTKQGGTTYSNFDTASTMYSYSPLETSEVVSYVTKYAGRMENGDFTHKFSSSDDALYDRDSVLGNALQDYVTTLNTEYATGASYPATSGTQPTAKPATAPTATPTAAPESTTAPTATPAAETTTAPTSVPAGETEMWKASDTAADVAAGTVLKGSWLTLVGGDTTYKTNSQTINNVSLTGRIVGSGTAPKADTVGTDGSGAALKVTPSADGTIGIYYKLNAGKTFCIIDEEGTTVSSHTNETGSNGYFCLSASVKAGTTYYAFGEGTNSEYWAAEYTVSETAPTATPTTAPTATPTPAPSSDEETVTDMWRASDTAANVSDGTTLKSAWLSWAGASGTYSKTSTTINSIKFTGKMTGSASQKYNDIASGVTGAVLKITPDKAGTVSVYYKLNKDKTFYITDSEGNEIGSHTNTTSASEYTYTSAAVEAGKTYYAFGDGTNAEYWAAEYTTSGAYSDDDTEPYFEAEAGTPTVVYGTKDGKDDLTDVVSYFTVTVKNSGDGIGTFDRIFLDADGVSYVNSNGMLSVTLAPDAYVVYGAIIEGMVSADITASVE